MAAYPPTVAQVPFDVAAVAAEEDPASKRARIDGVEPVN